MAGNFFTDCPDRIDLLKNRCDLDRLAGALEEAFGEPGTFASAEEAKQFYFRALEEMGRYAAQSMAPRAADVDRQGCMFENGEVRLPDALVEHLKRCAELGVFSGPIARKYGGLNLPRSVQLLALEMFGQGCPNTGLTIACFSMAEFLAMFGTEDQKARMLGKLMSNEWQTSMALTEAGAGSDLGKLRSTARRDGNRWLVNGTKQFITNGSGDLTFALVRTDPKSQGLDGLSVLLVPRKIDGKDNYRVTKIEDKVCLHGSPTCEIVFEDSIGELLGEEGNGWRTMSALMNSARLAMGALAVGIATAAHEGARDYATTRVTMGKPIAQHPMIAEMLHEMDVEIRAIRSLIAEAAIANDWMNVYRARGDEANFRRWKNRYRRLTPLCKYMATERAITISRNALQIYGGYGVCREYPAERLWRETIIYPIYEGTSQIQSLMVLKDTLRDVAAHAAGFLGSLAGAKAQALVTVDPVKRKLLEARNELNQGIRIILGSLIKSKFKSDIEGLRQKPIQEALKAFSLELLTAKTDLTFPFLCAERFTRISCDYYALKTLADRLRPGDTEREKLFHDFASLALPRMAMENRYLEERAPMLVKTLPLGA